MIADELTLYREVLAKLLSGEEDIEVVEKVSSGYEVLSYLVENPETDIVIIDNQFRDLECSTLIRKISEYELSTKVIVLTIMNNAQTMINSITAGAKAFLSKENSCEDLFCAIHSVHEGKSYYPQSQVNILLQWMIDNPSVQSAAGESNIDFEHFFTTRELEIFEYLADGYTSKEIADILELSVRTVENHKWNMMTKANVRNVPSLLTFAYKNNITQTLINRESKSPKDADHGEVSLK